MNSYKQKIESCVGKVKSSCDERSYVRELAAMVHDVSQEIRMKTILKRWRDVNSGRIPDRAPVWAKPVGCWREMLPEDSLICKDEHLRKMENYFRRILLKRDIDDDEPVYDYYNVDAVFDVTPDPPYGFAYKKHALDEVGSAWGYAAALEAAEDFQKLTVPEYHLNEQKTQDEFEKCNELFGDILRIQITAIPKGYLNDATICSPAGSLRGMEQMMMDMMLEPELIHHLMDVITKGVLNKLDAYESSGYLIPNINEPMFLSDPLRPGVKEGEYSLKDCWIAGNSQELDQVSPDMLQEFLIDYQNKIFERFGAVSYGCCENLTQKTEQVKTVRNLKVFVCSAWSDMQTIIDAAADNYCIMWRHSASDVTCLPTLDKVRDDTIRGAEMLKGCRYQVILRELESLFGRPNRIYDWAQMCKEVVSDS